MTAERPYADVLETALDLLERDGPPSRTALLALFPGREAHVDRVLGTLTSYRRLVHADRRESRAGSHVDVLPAGAVLGDFTVVGLIGQGSMGVVYRARQHSLGGREVALKVLRTSLAAKDPRFVERFRREARLASLVADPHVAEVYGFGTADGRAFFAMRLIEGRSLSDVLAGLVARRRLGWSGHARPEHVRRVVRLVRDLADGLAAIHRTGLVHRDVKPGNVLLARAGDDDASALEAHPVLVDFGLVRTAEASTLTGSLTRLGTPAYAAPESLLGREVDARADVFALGAILHDLACLTAAGERELASSGLPSAREANPAVDERLDAILRMALEERPDLRYPDAAAFATELERYLASEPIRALPETALGRARLWARRHPERALRAGAAAAAVGAVGAALFVALALPLYRAASRARGHELAGDLIAARGAWRDVYESALAPVLPFLAEGRARAFWDIEGFWARPLQTLERDAAQAHVLLRATVDRRAPPEDFVRFLTYELRLAGARPAGAPPGSAQRAERRIGAAQTAARLLTRAPSASLQAPYEPGSAPAALFDALMEIAAAPAPDADLELLRWAAAALGGTRSDAAFERVLPLVPARDVELSRVAATATTRLWWSMRASADERGSSPGLLARDPSLWIAWAEQAWAGAERELALHGEVVFQRAPAIDDPEAHRRGALLHVLTCLAWTRMELVDAGALDRAAWDALPAPLRGSLDRLEPILRAGRVGEAAPPAGSALEPSRSLWDMHVRGRADWIPQWMQPDVDSIYPPSTPATAQPRVEARPDRDAEWAGLAFVEADGLRGPALSGCALALDWSGELYTDLLPRVELSGREAYLSLTCLPPRAGRRAARVTVLCETPAVWFWPHGGGGIVRVAINGGEVAFDRRLGIGTERIEFVVSERALETHPDLRVRIEPTNDNKLWIHAVRVRYEDPADAW